MGHTLYDETCCYESSINKQLSSLFRVTSCSYNYRFGAWACYPAYWCPYLMDISASHFQSMPSLYMQKVCMQLIEQYTICNLMAPTAAGLQDLFSFSEHNNFIFLVHYIMKSFVGFNLMSNIIWTCRVHCNACYSCKPRCGECNTFFLWVSLINSWLYNMHLVFGILGSWITV